MSDAKNKHLDRIKKLLALSKSSNQNEAELAAARAAELMARHQINEAELGEFDADDLNINEWALDEARQITYWQGYAAQAAAHAFGGRMYANGDRVPDGKGGYRKRVRLMFVGREKDRDAAAYLYQYFVREIRRLADEAWTQRNKEDDLLNVMIGAPTVSVRSWKDSFRKGAAIRIQERIDEERRKAKGESQSTALVKVEEYEQKAEDFLNQTENLTRKSATMSSAQAFAAGRAAGDTVNTVGGGRGLAAPAPQIKGE